MADSRIQVRSAGADDVEAIASLVGKYAEAGQLLLRSAQSIAEDLDSWQVATSEDQLAGCGSLLPYGAGLAEIRSLAVLPAFQHRGVGSRLVTALCKQARRDGVQTVFALTRAVPFFEQMGFSAAKRESFPEKVWRDCRLCPLQDRCDEHAVVLALVPNPTRHLVQIGGRYVRETGS